jgi:hypothetical protein
MSPQWVIAIIAVLIVAWIAWRVWGGTSRRDRT